MDVAVVGSQGRNHRPQVRTNALSGHDMSVMLGRGSRARKITREPHAKGDTGPKS